MSPATPFDEEPTLLLHAYLDGELDPANALEIERRLASDATLATERDRLLALRKVIRERLPLERAPAALSARVSRSIGLQQHAAGPSWRALAASVVLAAVLASGSTWLVSQAPRHDSVMEQVVGGHIRAMMAAQPTDVSSSDRHTVKPWFNGRIPQAPRVIDLTNEGFPLVGARLDVIGRTPVPTLVYRHRQHLISLSAVPAAGEGNTPPAQRKADGYNLLAWSDGGVAYWAVSDLGAADLERFAQLFRAAAPEG